MVGPAANGAAAASQERRAARYASFLATANAQIAVRPFKGIGQASPRAAMHRGYISLGGAAWGYPKTDIEGDAIVTKKAGPNVERYPSLALLSIPTAETTGTAKENTIPRRSHATLGHRRASSYAMPLAHDSGAVRSTLHASPPSLNTSLQQGGAATQGFQQASQFVQNMPLKQGGPAY
jgi:hypothetical protein